MTTPLTIIIPCYNAANILPVTWPKFCAYLRAHEDVNMVFVDDKSRDATAAWIANRICEEGWGPRVRLVSNPVNLGKGGAICRGLGAVTTEWVCFTDVDLAYDLENIARMREYIRPGTLVVACRVHPESRYEIRPHFFKYIATRHLMSRLFNRVVRLLLVPDARDVQAGFKGGVTADLQSFVRAITKQRFSFDAELLFLAHHRGMRIQEIPVSYRFDSPASTVRVAADATSMLRDLLDIKWRALRGGYTSV